MQRKLVNKGLASLVFLAAWFCPLLGISTSLAQPLLSLDAAGFQGKGGRVYLEVYLMMQRDQLQFVPFDKGFQATVEFTLNFYSQDSLLTTRTWSVEDKIKDLGELTSKQRLPDIAIFNVPPGLYTVEAKARDVQRDTTYAKKLKVELTAFSDSALCLSDLELATRLEKTKEPSKFFKNDYLVIPNPDRLYGVALPMLYYYAEIYNLQGTSGSFTVDRLILNNQKQEIKRLPQKTQKKKGSSLVEVDGFSIATLETGTYYLQVAVEDQDNQQKAVREIKFFIFRAEDFTQARASAPKVELSQIDDEILKMNDEQVAQALEEIHFLLKTSELNQLKELNTEGKRQFLIRFWREHDPDPATPENEFKLTFEQRKQAAERYSVLSREGWRTDRGRVYVLYGPPDRVEYHTHELQTRPFEIWEYDALEGGVIFVFVDRNNFGDYRLVHSTKSGEISRSNWLEEEATIEIRK